MSSSPLPYAIPERRSLSSQAAESIRNAITEGNWTDHLPGERRLCDLFQVSRPTIRMALHLLAREGLIEIQQGSRTKLLTAPNHSNKLKHRMVGLVTQEPVSHMPLTAHQGVSTMRAHLAEQGFSTEILVCQTRSPRMQRRKLEEFVRQNSVFCCVLLSVSREVQEWFAEHSVPALVLGSCHPDVKLPSMDVDYRSVCRHAVGVFLAKGHRRIALLVPNNGVAGDIASEAGFREAFEQRPPDDEVQATIVRHSGTAQNIAFKLDRLLSRSNPPTALLVAKPKHVFIVILYLLKRGLRVPDTISLMARDYDHVFEAVSPPIAHYNFGEEAFARRLSRLMLQMVREGHLAPEPYLIFPKSFAGRTIKRIN